MTWPNTARDSSRVIAIRPAVVEVMCGGSRGTSRLAPGDTRVRSLVPGPRPVTSRARPWSRAATLATTQRRESRMGSTDVTTETHGAGAAPGTIDMKLEVITIPVSDVDRAKSFYESLGWRLDADFDLGSGIRVVQFTPTHSGCSVTFGSGIVKGPAWVGRADGDRRVEPRGGARGSDQPRRGRERADSTAVPRASSPAWDLQRQSCNSYATFSEPDGKRLDTPRGHDAASGPGCGATDPWMSARSPSSCTRRLSTTMRSRRPPLRMTGGTGTRPTSMPGRRKQPRRGRRGRRPLHGGG